MRNRRPDSTVYDIRRLRVLLDANRPILQSDLASVVEWWRQGFQPPSGKAAAWRWRAAMLKDVNASIRLRRLGTSLASVFRTTDERVWKRACRLLPFEGSDYFDDHLARRGPLWAKHSVMKAAEISLSSDIVLLRNDASRVTQLCSCFDDRVLRHRLYNDIASEIDGLSRSSPLPMHQASSDYLYEHVKRVIVSVPAAMTIIHDAVTQRRVEIARWLDSDREIPQSHVILLAIAITRDEILTAVEDHLAD